ncbi:hypothetical protein BC1_00020 [Bacillus phage BC-1]|nr:hypothetical protein BC1_00020 [Bacillus phage BC-1]
MRTETITTLNSEYKPFVKQYEYDDFNRVISIVESEQDDEKKKKTSYQYSPYTEKITSN